MTLYMMSSPEDAWDHVVRPWFDKVASRGLQNQLATVVTASRSQAYFFRSRLLAEDKSLFGVKFLSPPQLREILLRGGDLRVPLREHLRLLLAVTAEEFDNTKRPAETRLTAKFIARDPDRFLRAFDEVRAAGWGFDELDSPELRKIAARFELHARECGFTFVHDADRAALAKARRSEPLFSALLLFGFNAAHWPLWPLLQAATISAEEATVMLSHPRDEAPLPPRPLAGLRVTFASRADATHAPLPLAGLPGRDLVVHGEAPARLDAVPLALLSRVFRGDQVTSKHSTQRGYVDEVIGRPVSLRICSAAGTK